MAFEQEGVTSIWLGRQIPEGSVDVLHDLCGVEFYDIDFQECIVTESGDLCPVGELLSQLSYSQSFLEQAIAVADELGVSDARWVLMQLDFAYDPDRVRSNAAADPVFLGCLSWEDDESWQPVEDRRFTRRRGGRVSREAMAAAVACRVKVHPSGPSGHSAC